MNGIILSLIAGVAALIGGYAAFKSRSRLNLALGFTAGIILGVVAFDLLPEIFSISYEQALNVLWPMIALVAGFLSFHIVEKLILIHHTHETSYSSHVHPYVGVAGASALAGHSFLDGMSIGLAFQVNQTVGVAVAIAVIGHRFADGFNTTNIMLLHKNTPKQARKLLIIASVMPVLGALTAMLFNLSPEILAIYLGFFAGFLLYIGASDILPQAHSKGASRLAIGLTILGAVFPP
ncbi:ZIP family metal transporter, partial [Candidatus Saccharibacteria bacterium]|nr:ZIP family metal transporter [Candidatus Saccharibacteria bacterium]